MYKKSNSAKFKKAVFKVKGIITDIEDLQDDLIDQLEDYQENSKILQIEEAIGALDIVLKNLESVVYTNIEFP